MVQDCFLNDYLIAVLTPQWNGEYEGRICVAGRPTIIQSYDNGELDIVITGVMKCRLEEKIQTHPYLMYESQPLQESFLTNEELYEDLELFKDFIWKFIDLHPTLKNQASMIEELLIDPESIINYTVLLLISDPSVKTKIMESASLEEKASLIKNYLGPKTIELGPFLPPINTEKNL